MFKRLFVCTSWYRWMMEVTIRSTLRKSGNFTQEDIGRIWNLYRETMKKLSDMLEDISSEYHLAWSVMIYAIYRICLQNGIENDRAIELAGEIVFDNMGAQNYGIYLEKMLDKSKNPFDTMVKISKKQETEFFGSTFRFERVFDTTERYSSLVHRCFYLDVYRRLETPELMKIACRFDLISWSQGINPEKHKVFFSRPKTLGLDGVPCDFSFRKL